MAAGLVEGHTEEGERGGGEPENRRVEAEARTDRHHTDTSSSQGRGHTEEDGRTDGGVGLFLFLRCWGTAGGWGGGGQPGVRLSAA